MSGTWVDALVEVHRIFGLLILVYVAMSAAIYLFLTAVAAFSLWRDRDLSEIQYSSVLETELVPPLSIIVPAYNEEINIVGSVRSLLSINYKQFEIVVVNDGSKDKTVQIMLEEFDMTEVKGRVPFSGLKKETKPIRAVYRSLRHPNLVLVDKENGGKADALNVGINVCRYPYFVSLDGDTVLDPDAFIKVVKPIMDARPGEEIVATGGSVGIANGSTVDSGYLNSASVRLSGKPLVVMQVVEYLRAFLMGRIGLSRYNMLLLVSGAFGVFKKSWVVEAGGYETGTIGEDMELTVRLHELIRQKKSKARIVYVPEPVCWTEAPESTTILKRQRTRWQRGLYESLRSHKNMILNPRYGRVGLGSMPFFLFVELLGPLVELLGYVTVLLGFFLDRINVEISLMLALVMLLFGSLMSTMSVLFEEWRFHNYNRISDTFRLFFYALSESFWYRPLMTWWRTIGLFEAIRGKKHGWGEMTRVNVLGANKKPAIGAGISPIAVPQEVVLAQPETSSEPAAERESAGGAEGGAAPENAAPKAPSKPAARKPARRLWAGLAALMLLLLAPWIVWEASPAKTLSVAVLDKTVDDDSYREHKGLFWILNQQKYRMPGGGKYLYDRDYYGYDPAVNGERPEERTMADLNPDTQLIYVADTYGPAETGIADDPDAGVPTNAGGQEPTARRGGMKTLDVNVLETAASRGAMLIAEFNSVAAPTEEPVRNRAGALLGMKWTGWTARYFPNLAQGAEIPDWVPSRYREITGQTWSYTGGGFLFVHESGDLFVLRDGEESDGGARISFTDAGSERFGIDANTRYNYWFDIVTASGGSDTLAEYELPLTANGRAVLAERGVPEQFPAVLRREVSAEEAAQPLPFGATSSPAVGQVSYYFAGDYADRSGYPFWRRYAGWPAFKSLFTLDTRNSEDAFYWDVYVPMMQKVLAEAADISFQNR